MNAWILAPILAPLTAAAVTALGRRSRVVQRTTALTATLTVLTAGLVLLLDGDVAAVTPIGGHPPAFAIVLVADPFAALLVTATGLLATAVLVFAVAGADDHHPFFHPLALVLVAAACGSFLTGDLFNLFVFLEVALITSYVLATLDATGRQVRATTVYVATNLLGSLLLLTAIGWTYASRGTVSFAVLARAEGPLPLVPGAMLLVALAVKAGVVPVGGWLPIAYRTAPRTVAALFAGLLTTIGVVGIYRVYALVLHGDPIYRPVLLVVAVGSVIVGALAAAGRAAPEETLAFIVIAQVGFMLLGPGLFGAAALAAGVFFVAQDVLVKTAAFLAVGTARDQVGRDEGTSLITARPVLVGGYLVAAFSLVGLPPLSGFAGKLLLLDAALARGQVLVAVLALAGSLLLLVAVLQPWSALIGAPAEEVHVHPTGPGPGRLRLGRTLPVVVLTAAALALGLWPAWLHGHAQRAATWLEEPGRYVEAVLG